MVSLYSEQDEIIRETTKAGEVIPGKEVEVAWACDDERGALSRWEGDGNGTREQEERKA